MRENSNGGPNAKVGEPLTVFKNITVNWKREGLDLAKLAKLHWIDGLSYDELGKHFNRSPITMRKWCKNLINGKVRHVQLNPNFREKILTKINGDVCL